MIVLPFQETDTSQPPSTGHPPSQLLHSYTHITTSLLVLPNPTNHRHVRWQIQEHACFCRCVLRFFSRNVTFSPLLIPITSIDRSMKLKKKAKTEPEYGAQSTVVSSQNGKALAERSELCKTNVNGILPPPYNNISNMICTPIWNTHILRYHKGEDNLVTFIVSAVYTTGWVGIGFSKDGRMVGASAVVGWISKKGHPRIKQYYLQGTRPSQVIADAGELDLTKVPPAVALSGASIHMAFQAKFEHPLNKQLILLAIGTSYPTHYRLTKHVDKTVLMFDFSAGSASSVNHHQMKAAHGVLAVMTWGLLLPVGAIIARYMRHKDPLWYYLHAGIQFTGFLLGLAAVVVGQHMYVKISADVSAHRGIGIFAFVLSILQILAFFLRPNKDAKIRKFWNLYHGWFGRIALFFGAFNAMWGIHVASAGVAWKAMFGIQMTVILITVVLLEYYCR
ncbi:hypothetical protein K2173_003456 [Erythroxylum novogranatense]|uniref:Cytochrome b561 and DOMON domain-containing protein n=1 Tax=Erythroxylum novogranatense TaxID=1862640 RepID=A0AAV8S8R8_9ROSI|nr:hypothetical protein K2173_003456 [Erythroxylum novogranatense]